MKLKFMLLTILLIAVGAGTASAQQRWVQKDNSRPDWATNRDSSVPAGTVFGKLRFFWFAFLLAIFGSASVSAQEFKEDKFSLTYYDLNYSPKGQKTEPFFVQQGLDKKPKALDVVEFLHHEGKPGGYNFSKFKNRWQKGETVYLPEFSEEVSKDEICNLLKIKKTSQDNELLFVYSGVFTVEKGGEYRVRFPERGGVVVSNYLKILGIGTSPKSLQTAAISWAWKSTFNAFRSSQNRTFQTTWGTYTDKGGVFRTINPPKGNNPVQIAFEPKTYVEQWEKYSSHWLKLAAGTKYYFVLVDFSLANEPGFPKLNPKKGHSSNFSGLFKIVKGPDEEVSIVKPFKSSK